MAAAAIAGAAIDFGARATWAGLNETQFATHWDAYVGSGELRARCPKVGIGYFYYPSLGRKLRGAMAKAPIAKGERLCEVPVGSLLSTFSVGNSTLRPVMDAVEAEASAPVETSASACASWSASVVIRKSPSGKSATLLAAGCASARGMKT